MIPRLALLLTILLTPAAAHTAEVLIVADEFPAMEYVAEQLQAETGVVARIVDQHRLPAALGRYPTVAVYIHGELKEGVETALIRHTRAGATLVVLHHSISSGKRKNRYWFDFLGVELKQGSVAEGGYKWIEPVSLDIVNLAPDHFITTHETAYPASIPFPTGGEEKAEEPRPAFTLHESEVYLNHTLLEGPRTLLLGFRYQDGDPGPVYRQAHAGWIRPAEQGWIIYLMPGHSVSDFENPTYRRIVLNALIFKP